VIERAQGAGIVSILVPGWDVPSSEAALELSDRYPELITAAVGVHPHHASEADESAWSQLEALVADPRARAVGEIGLDFFRNISPPEAQRDTFARQLDLARRTGKPVLVHDRDAHKEVTEGLVAWRGALGGDVPAAAFPAGVLHCFSGDSGMATVLAARGFLISFALPVSFRSAEGPRAAAARLAERSILVETDAPWLGPGPDRRNEPTTVLRVAAEVARLRGTSPETIASVASANLARLLHRTPSATDSA